MKRKILMFLTVIFALVCAMGVLAACGEDDEIPVSGDEVGEYYYDAEAGEYLVTLSEGCNFTFALGGDAKSGTYKLDGTTLTMTFKDGEEEAISANLADNALEFTYKGVNYRFLKKITYTVKFVEGGTLIQEVSVVNGKRVPRPEDPTKDRAIFVGWCSDSSFRNEYRFVEPVTGDLTIYAHFEEAIPNPIEFTVNFDLRYEGGEAIEPVQTIGGRVFGLTKPTRTGDTFVGWWVSHYEDASKLTYRYTNQILTENTTLYAVWASEEPAVSVSEKGINWQASGVNNNYSVAVKTADGQTVGETTTGQDSYSFDFTKQPAGEYTVEVTMRGKTTIAYYKNKALARVSVFKVENNVLIFNPIKNAEKYLISIVCGNPDHDHSTPVDNGNKTSYDFSTCDMRKEGIEFTVTAQAAGYMDSVSVTFVFNQTLKAVGNLKVDPATEAVSWDAVENATSYILTVRIGDELAFNENIGNVTSYSLKAYARGEITVTVMPVARGWNSPEAATTAYNKTRLSTPANVRVEGSEIVWDGVDGASEYEVKINDVSVGKTDKTSFPIPTEGSENGFTVSVCAIAPNAADNSLWSDALNITAGEVGELTYKSGVVSWDPVYGAVKYVVKVNDGREIIVSETSANIEFTAAGENTIYVCAILDETSGARSDWASTVVFAYKVTFDPQGGAIVPAQYKANGDPVVFSESAKEGYNFDGWFTAPGGAEGGGVRFTDGLFEGEADITLYAAWESKPYKLELDIGKYGNPIEGDAYAYYGQILHLPVPESNDITRAFAGWFAEANGVGTQYTNFEGTGYKAWSELKGRKLYAHWVEIYTVKELQNGLSISKGPGIGYVREITIPVTVDGVPVTTVDDFSSSSNLRVVNIPDTIQVINIAAASAAFRSCTNLREVNIYEVEGNHDRIYGSVDGVLIFQNPRTGLRELVFVPQAKSGAFRIPDGVQVIPELVFQQVKKITSVEIPASVTFIAMQAFYPGSATSESLTNKITTITFLAGEEGVEELPLTISSRAFQNCTNLTTITLPARLNEFTLDAFQGCSKLVNIEISGDGAYISKDGLLCKNIDGGVEIVYAPMGRSGTFTIVPGITSIGESAFSGNLNITKLVIPGYVSNIGKEAFKGNKSLTEIEFEGDEKDVNLTIGASAFYGCTGLVEVTLPANLYTLKTNAFGGCSKLVEVYVESGAGRDSLDFESNAFLSTNNNATVTTAHLGKDVPEFDVAGVFGSKLARVIVHPDNKNYSSDEEGVLFNGDKSNIVYYPMAKEGPYVIPSTVTRIGERVFQERIGLTSITIPNTVTSIGNSAFKGCVGLKEVIFVAGGTEKLIIEDGTLLNTSSGVTVSGGAFQGCSELTKIELPARTEKIGIGAFAGCGKLSGVIIPEGVITIGDYAFSSNNSLTTVTIPASVTLIGNGESGKFTAFDNCVNLAEIKVASGNKNYTVIDNVLYGITEGKISDLLFAPRNTSGTNGVVNIPGTVERIWANAFYLNKNIREINFAALEGELSIGDNAFSECVALAKVQLPQGLTVIGKMTFNKCKALREINIPNSVTSIAVNAFYMCSALQNVNFATGNEETPLVIESSTASSGTDSEGAFYKCTSLTEITLPERTTKLGSGAFAGCTSLVTVNLPASLETIDKFAFYKLPVRNVYIAEGSKLTEIGEYVFYESAIENITLPEGLVKIGKYAFAYCSNLTSIVFPNSLEMIAGDAFGHSYLKEVRIPASVKTLGTPKIGSTAASGSVFWYSPALEKVVFEDGSQIEELYGSTFSYCPRLTTVDFGKNSRLKILDRDFSRLVSLPSLKIPASVTEISPYAFEGNVSMTSVTFEEGSNLASIGNQAFIRTGLTEFAFPESTADTIDLGTALFFGCRNLTRVHLSSKISSIEGIFNGCVSIQTVTVAEGNQNFKVNADTGIVTNLDGTVIRFVFGVSANTLVLANGITEISEGAFFGNTTITSVSIPKSVTSIGDNAFRNCFNLTTVTFEAGSELTTIGAHAFQDCWALQKITLPTSLTTLVAEGYTFQGCKSLTTVDFDVVVDGEVVKNTNLIDIPQYAFADCVALSSITLPASVARIRERAFSNTGFTELDLSGYAALVDFTGNKNTRPAGTAGTTSYVFSDCTKLTYVKMPNTAYRLGVSTFKGCSSLRGVLPNPENPNEQVKQGIDFGEKAMIIGNSCFQGTPLVYVNIPASVTSFGTYAFADCTGLSKVDFNGNTNVKALGNYMFQNCSALTSITLPTKLNFLGKYTFEGSGLTSIDLSGLSDLKVLGTSATACSASSSRSNDVYLFANCVSLQKVKLPANLTKIGPYVFDGCTSLNLINLDKIALIGAYAFQNCGFESISLPAAALKSTSTLGSYAFRLNAKLQSVSFEEGSKCIGVRMFEDCTALKSITIPASITAFNTYAFAGCTALERVTFEDGSSLTKLPTYAFKGCSALSEVNFGNNSFTEIGSSMFKDCSSLESISLPDTITFIGTEAFRDSGLKRIDLSNTKITMFAATATVKPESIVSSNSSVFYGCENLTEVILPKALVGFGKQVFFGCRNLKEIDFGSVATIGDEAFANSGLVNVTIPKTVSKIGRAAFGGCESLNWISVAMGNEAYSSNNGILYDATGMLLAYPAGMPIEGGVLALEDGTGIAAGALYGVNVSELILPDGFTMIGEYAFYGSNIRKITIPDSVTKIGNNAFSYSAFESVTIPANAESIGNASFEYSEIEEITILTPNLVYYNYSTNGAGPFDATNLFRYCYNLRKVTLAEGATKIGSNWFLENTALEAIVLPSTIQSIATNAFAGSGITEIVIPASVTEIGMGAFAKTEFLRKLTFEDGDLPLKINPGIAKPTSISYYGVFEESALETVVLSNRVTELPLAVFRNNVNLTSIPLPEGLLRIGERAFFGCTSLEQINLPEGLVAIGTYAFANTGLVSIVIPDSIETTASLYTNLGSNAFNNCYKLTTVKLSKNLVQLSSELFRDCTALTTIEIPENVSSIGSGTFENCTSLNLVIPRTVLSCSDAFVGWGSDQTIYLEASQAEVCAWWTNMNTDMSWLEGCNAKLVFNYTPKA